MSRRCRTTNREVQMAKKKKDKKSKKSKKK